MSCCGASASDRLGSWAGLGRSGDRGCTNSSAGKSRTAGLQDHARHQDTIGSPAVGPDVLKGQPCGHVGGRGARDARPHTKRVQAPDEGLEVRGHQLNVPAGGAHGCDVELESAGAAVGGSRRAEGGGGLRGGGAWQLSSSAGRHCGCVGELGAAGRRRERTSPVLHQTWRRRPEHGSKDRRNGRGRRRGQRIHMAAG